MTIDCRIQKGCSVSFFSRFSHNQLFCVSTPFPTATLFYRVKPDFESRFSEIVNITRKDLTILHHLKLVFKDNLW